jgi:cytochrome c553
MRNILIAAALLLFGCSEKKDDINKFEEINKSVQSIITDVQKGTSNAIEKADEISQKANKIGDDIAQKAAETKQAAEEALYEAAEAGRDILQKTNETLSNINKKADEIINTSAETLEAAKQKTDETISNISKKVDNIINESANTIEAAKQKAENIAQAATAPLTNADKGKKLFVTCIPCHGTKAEKSAVNKSQIINKWSREQILKALKGYKDGTYGGAFKDTMIPTVKRLSDDDMEELSAYIVALGK